MHTSISIVSKYQVNPKISFQLFDAFVSPILNYKCQIWGFTKSEELERIYLKVCRKVLGVKQSTSNATVYGELGRYPLYMNVTDVMSLLYINFVRAIALYHDVHYVQVFDKTYLISSVFFVVALLSVCFASKNGIVIFSINEDLFAIMIYVLIIIDLSTIIVNHCVIIIMTEFCSTVLLLVSLSVNV